MKSRSLIQILRGIFSSQKENKRAAVRARIVDADGNYYTPRNTENPWDDPALKSAMSDGFVALDESELINSLTERGYQIERQWDFKVVTSSERTQAEIEAAFNDIITINEISENQKNGNYVYEFNVDEGFQSIWDFETNSNSSFVDPILEIHDYKGCIYALLEEGFTTDNLEKITLNGVDNGEGLEFLGLTSLKSAKLPLIGAITPEMFSGCTSLKEISADSATSINGSGFKGCSALEKIDLPSVVYINNNAFENCRWLKRVHIPSCETISENAFKGCSILSYLFIPSIDTIDEHGFGFFLGVSSDNPPRLEIYISEEFNNTVLPDGILTIEDNHVDYSIHYII